MRRAGRETSTSLIRRVVTALHRRPRLGRRALSLLVGCWLAGSLSAAFAQPGPPGRAGPDRSFDPAGILAQAQPHLEQLRPMAIYLHRHGPQGERRELKVLLGDGERVYARFQLDPVALEPVPIGLETFVSALPQSASPEALLRALEPLVPEALALSSVVVPERAGYKLLLVFEGRIVGELRLDGALEPVPAAKWLEEWRESPWRFPE